MYNASKALPAQQHASHRMEINRAESDAGFNHSWKKNPKTKEIQNPLAFPTINSFPTQFVKFHKSSPGNKTTETTQVEANCILQFEYVSTAI